MSRFFRKSKKTFAVLLTIAFVLSIAAVPVFASVTYTSLTAPTVSDSNNQTLGTVSIKVDPIVDNLHEVLVEVEDGWNIRRVSVTNVVYTGDVGPTALNITPGVYDPDDEQFIFDGGEGVDSFVIFADTTGMQGEELEVWLSFDLVDVDSTGDIRAYFTNVRGQLLDGDALIGRARGGELTVAVRDFDYFSDQASLSLRITEDLRGTFGTTLGSDDLILKLPRGFKWVPLDEAEWVTSRVFGDPDFGFAAAISPDGRELILEFAVDATLRTAIDLVSEEFAFQVDDPNRAQKGEVMAEVKGSYDATPDEIMVGVYGDYEFTVTAREAETVYAGRIQQDIADITIAEDIAGTFVRGRTVTMKLPSWAKWGDLEAARTHEGVRLELANFYGRDGHEAVYRVAAVPDDPDEPAAPRLRDMQIVLAPNAPVGEDVVVEIAGSTGARGEVVVGKVAAPATMEVDPVNVIGIGRSNQPLGTITFTEAEAGMFKDGKVIQLMLDQDVTWAAGITVEVEEGDIELGTPTGAGSRTLSIRVDAESDEPSTIKVTGTVTTLRTVPEGDSLVRLRGSAVVETRDSDAKADQWDSDDTWYQIDGKDVVRVGEIWPDLGNAVVRVAAVVGVPAPPIEEPEPATVMMWIGSTTYTVNGVEGEMDVAPFIENDRTFVPVRFIAEALGAEADWGPEDGLTEWVTLTKGDIVVTLTIGSNIITVTDGDETYTVMSDVAAQIINDRTFLPARAVGEIFGAEFDWGPKQTLTEWVSFTLP